VPLAKFQLFFFFVVEEDDPKTFSEAIASKYGSFWKESTDDEMNLILSNNTWVLKHLPLECKLIQCKWVLNRKRNIDGIVHTFKARLVTEGFT